MSLAREDLYSVHRLENHSQIHHYTVEKATKAGIVYTTICGLKVVAEPINGEVKQCQECEFKINSYRRSK